MGTIISTKMKDKDKVVFEIVTDYEEAKQLQGNMDKVHIISENSANVQARLSERGKKGATKYFLIPKELRSKIKFNEPASCQRIDTKYKTIFVYIMSKF